MILQWSKLNIAPIPFGIIACCLLLERETFNIIKFILERHHNIALRMEKKQITTGTIDKHCTS